jgi:hypothetical protein
MHGQQAGGMIDRQLTVRARFYLEVGRTTGFFVK